MRLLVRMAALCYPAGWRARYGAELDALLEDSGAGCAELLDVGKGAIAMQMTRGNVWTFISVCAVVGLLAAGAAALRMPAVYRSTALMRLPAGQDEAIQGLNKAEQQVLSRRSLAEIVTSYSLYPEERKRLPLEDIVQDLRNRGIQIRLLSQPGNLSGTAFSVTFDYTDPSKAQAVNETLVAKMTGALKGTEVLDPATLPERAFSPNRAAIVTLGALLGIAAAVLLLGIRRWPMVAGAGLIVAMVALPVSYLIPDRYRSMAVLRVSSGDAAAAGNEVTKNGAFLQSLIAGEQLYPGDPDGLGKLHRRLSVRQLAFPRGQRRAIVVTFDDSNRYKAQQVVRDIVARFGTISTAQIEVLDPPSLAEQSFFPNRLAIVLTASAGGLVLGAMMVAARRRRTLVPRPA
jgi:hypothetical protein